MAPIRISWNLLLNLTELGFDLGSLPELSLSNEIGFSLSILTAATRRDRKLLRCDNNGVLLVGDPWTGLISVETDELYVNAGTADSFTASVENKGVLIATPSYLVKASMIRTAGGTAEVVYIAPYQGFWFPGPVYSIEVDDVPAGATDSFYVGITAFN